MSDIDTTVDQEDVQEDLDSGQVEETQDIQDTENHEQESEDPLDNIEDIDELRGEAKKFRGIATRKAKPQQEDKPVQKTNPAPTPRVEDGLSSMDTIALIDAKVTNKDDIETVQEYARLKGLSIGEALATPLVKSILKDNAEQRQTAEASNTAPARRGSIKLTDEQILSNAQAGKFTDDPEALAEARMAAKRNK